MTHQADSSDLPAMNHLSPLTYSISHFPIDERDRTQADGPIL